MTEWCHSCFVIMREKGETCENRTLNSYYQLSITIW